jgi:hypothetical protein
VIGREGRQAVGNVFQHSTRGDHPPATRMSGRQRIASRVFGWRRRLTLRTLRPDAMAALYDRPTGDSEDGGDGIPGSPFAMRSTARGR